MLPNIGPSSCLGSGPNYFFLAFATAFLLETIDAELPASCIASATAVGELGSVGAVRAALGAKDRGVEPVGNRAHRLHRHLIVGRLGVGGASSPRPTPYSSRPFPPAWERRASRRRFRTRRQPVGEWRVILRRTAIQSPRRGCTAGSIRAWAEGLWVMVIRIGTWNLENLFKPPNPFAPKTEEEYEAKLDALASAITRMNPHVLAVRGRRPGGLRRAC